MAVVTVSRDTLRAKLPYLGEGAAAVVEALLRNLPQDVKQSDSMTLYVASASQTGTIVDAGAGSRPLVVIAQSKGTLSYVRLYDASTVASGSQTGTTAANALLGLIPVATNTDELTCMYLAGASWERRWTQGITVSGATAQGGATAPANLPIVYILFADK